MERKCNRNFLFPFQAGRNVRDLFEDLRDGHNLLSLLEVLSGEVLVRIILSCHTLIRFGKFEEITVLMEKHVTLTQTQVISTQWTLKRPKKLLKAKFFSNAKFEGQRPNLSNFMIFSVIRVSLWSRQ